MLYLTSAPPWPFAFLHPSTGSRALGLRGPWGRRAHGECEGSSELVFSAFSFWFYNFEPSATQHFVFKEHYSESNVLLSFFDVWK